MNYCLICLYILLSKLRFPVHVTSLSLSLSLWDFFVLFIPKGLSSINKIPVLERSIHCLFLSLSKIMFACFEYKTIWCKQVLVLCNFIWTTWCNICQWKSVFIRISQGFLTFTDLNSMSKYYNVHTAYTCMVCTWGHTFHGVQDAFTRHTGHIRLLSRGRHGKDRGVGHIHR